MGQLRESHGVDHWTDNSRTGDQPFLASLGIRLERIPSSRTDAELDGACAQLFGQCVLRDSRDRCCVARFESRTD